MDNLLCDAIYSIEFSMQKGKKLVYIKYKYSHTCFSDHLY